MKILKVGNITLQDRKLRVCVPIAYKTEGEIISEAKLIEQSKDADLAEWRIDWYEEVSDREKRAKLALKIREILNGKPLIITLRTAQEGGEYTCSEDEYKKLITECIEDKLSEIIDIEANRGIECAKSLVNLAHKNKIKVIASKHNFNETPSREDIVKEFEEMLVCDADIYKNAVMPNSYVDVENLLEATALMKKKHPNTFLISMSMGEMGRISRVCGGLYGSIMSFGTIGKPSAPGQMDVKQLKRMIKNIENV